MQNSEKTSLKRFPLIMFWCVFLGNFLIQVMDGLPLEPFSALVFAFGYWFAAKIAVSAALDDD